ncbi:MAG TPA: sulfur globule protein precursor [Xanthobacteraceae bacterium]|jgi:hypothetical protein
MRSILLSLTAAAALGIAALAPTAASAAPRHHGYHHHRPHFGRIFFAPRPYVPAYAYGACVYRKRVVPTPWGPRVHLVPVCY